MFWENTAQVENMILINGTYTGTALWYVLLTNKSQICAMPIINLFFGLNRIEKSIGHAFRQKNT